MRDVGCGMWDDDDGSTSGDDDDDDDRPYVPTSRYPDIPRVGGGCTIFNVHVHVLYSYENREPRN